MTRKEAEKKFAAALVKAGANKAAIRVKPNAGVVEVIALGAPVLRITMKLDDLRADGAKAVDAAIETANLGG